jgi:hypothetical protein
LCVQHGELGVYFVLVCAQMCYKCLEYRLVYKGHFYILFQILLGLLM